MTNNIYDPSDLGNNINSFDIVECCKYVPIDMYILLPNLGYGFVSHVLETFAKKAHRITPGGMFSAVAEEDKKKQTGEATLLLNEKEKFVMMGSGYEIGHVLAKIPLNSPCAKKVKIEPTMKLPIAFRIRELGSATATSAIYSHPVVSNEQLALYGMMASVAQDGTDDTIDIKIAKAIAALHFRAASDLTTNEIDQTTNGNKFTGIGEEGDRVEFTHLFPNELIQQTYQDVVAKDTADVPWSECTMRAAVFVSFTNEAGDLRVYYSPSLTEKLLPLIQIEGKDTAPQLEFSKLVYAFGVAEADRANMQPWLEFVEAGNEKSITGLDYNGMFTGSEFITTEMFSDSLHTGPIENLTVMNRTLDKDPGQVPYPDQTITATLLTPMPPILSEGRIYRDSVDKDDDAFYLPFSAMYLLPLVSASRYATTETEPCQICGGTTKVGYSHCIVCDHGVGILCPDCITNTEIVNGTRSLVPGYASALCPECNASGNKWSEYSPDYITALNQSLLGKIPCPSCFARANGKAILAFPGTQREEFISWLGKGPTGTGTCQICSGKGYIPCPSCMGNTDGLSAVPGYQRHKCPTCYDSDSNTYKGLSTAIEGRLTCNDSNLAYAGTNQNTMMYYNHLYDNAAPTCGGGGTLSPSKCPACDGNGLSYRFTILESAIYDVNVTPEDKSGIMGVTKTTVIDPPVSPDFVTKISMNQPIGSEIAVYVKIPSGATEWANDSVTDVFKWVPPYMYEVVQGTEIYFYTRLPKGTEVKVHYKPPQYTFIPDGITNPGYYKLSAQGDISADTVYDGGLFAYVSKPGDIPAYTGIRSAGITSLFEYTYANPDVPDTLPEGAGAGVILHREGFANLADAIRQYYEFLSDHKKVLPHIGTAKAVDTPDPGCVSRFIYAPTNASLLQLTGDNNYTSWISLSRFADVPTLPGGFMAALSDRTITRGEFGNCNLEDMSTLLDGHDVTEDECTRIKNSIGTAMSLGTLEYCLPDDIHRFSCVSKTTVDKILNNSAGADVKAGKGAPIMYDPTTPDSSNDELIMKPFRPSVDISDVSMSNIGGIPVSNLFSSFLSVDDTTLSSSALELATSLKVMINKLEKTILSIGIKLMGGAIGEFLGDVISPQPMFDQSHIARNSENDGVLSQRLTDTKNLLGAGDNPNITEFIGVLTEYKASLEADSKADRPSNITQSASKARGDYTMAAAILTSIAGSLVKPKVVSDGVEYGFLSFDSNSNSTESIFDYQSTNMGLYVYNMRKSYYVVASMISCVVAVIERLIVYISALDRGYDPFPYTTVENTQTGSILPSQCDFQVYGFLTNDGNPCYPKIATDIVLDGMADLTTNKISLFAPNESDIKYDIKLEVPEIDEASLKPIPVLGLGVTETLDAEPLDWDNKDRYAFQPRGIFSRFIGESPGLVMGNLELPSLSRLVGIQSSISNPDYMIYAPDGISYNNGGTRQSVNLTSDELGTALYNGLAGAVMPPVASVVVEGEISMSDIFPFLTGGPLVVPLPTAIRIDNVEFASGKPITILPIISGIPCLYATAGIPGTFEEAGDNLTKNILPALKKASQDMVGFLTTPVNVISIFNTAVTDASMEYVFPIVGQADTILSGPTGGQGESLAMCYLMKEAGATLKSTYLDGEEVNITNFVSTMGSSNWKADSTSEDHKINYNLWLSKRRAYTIFVMLMSELLYNRRTTAPNWKDTTNYVKYDLVTMNGLVYNSNEDQDSGEFDPGKWTVTTLETVLGEGEPIMRTEVSYSHPITGNLLRYRVDLTYSTTQPTQSSSVISRKVFQCYGLGSIFQKEETGDNIARSKQRVAYVLVNVPASQPSARMWGLNHLGRLMAAPFCTELGITGDSATPPSNNYLGGWACPKIGTDGVWEGKWTTLNRVESDPEVANTNTETFLKDMYDKLTTGGNWETVLAKMKELGQNPSAVNAGINNFMGTTNAMAAFAVNRSGNLTDQIWLVITKL